MMSFSIALMKASRAASFPLGVHVPLHLKRFSFFFFVSTGSLETKCLTDRWKSKISTESTEDKECGILY